MFNRHDIGWWVDVWQDLPRPQVLWELATIALCVGLAALAARAFERRHGHAGAQVQSRVARLGRGSARRLIFPLVAALLLYAAASVLRVFHRRFELLGVAIALLLALALIRLVAYGLRQAFAPSGTLAALERYVAVVVWLTFALYVIGILPEVVDWLEGVVIPVGTQKLNLWQIAHGTFAVLMTLLAALWASGAVETRLMRAGDFDPSLRLVLARLSRALLVTVAILISLPLVGIDLTTLSVFGGALGVGLGFGLQKIASNYVSGFILLLDRSIRPGNMITLDNYAGEVTQMTTRYTVLRALNGVEAIVPNDLLINSVVQNQTFTSPRVRISLPVQIAYQSDIERAMKILEAAAGEHPRVVRDPAPRAFLAAFADSGINLELGFWIADPREGTLAVRSDINLAIWRAFRAEGIEIPYPQREVRLLSGDGEETRPAAATISSARV
jgi:small-conductance mechanosensitive channel